MPRFPAVVPLLRLALPLGVGLLCHGARAQSNGLEPQRVALLRAGQALSRIVVKAQKVNGRLGYGFYEGACLFGVKLRPGALARENFVLKAGQSYVFIGGGDKTARNVDLTLRDASGRIVSQDAEADAAPFLLFQPKRSGRYSLALALRAGWSGPAFCAVTLLHKGGIAVPLERIVEAAIRMDYASFDALRAAQGGRFNEAPGTWGLYGAVVGPGQNLTLPAKRYGAIKRGLVAVGDRRVTDLDLALLDGRGKVIAQDVRHGASPHLARKTDAGSYAARVSNRSSSGPSLVMAALFDLPAPATSPVAIIAAKKAVSAAAPAAPDPQQSPQVSPFAGQWKGDWAGEQQAHEGQFKMRVQSDGTVNGHFSCPALKVAARFQGSIAADGTLRLSYTQSKQPVVAQGTLKFADETRRQIAGRVSFSAPDALLGQAECEMTRN